MVDEPQVQNSDVVDPSPQPPNNSDKLYQTLLKDGYTPKNLGTLDEFSERVKNPINANKLYSTLMTDGYTEKNLGTLKDFQTRLAPEKKNPIQNASTSGSNNSHANVIATAQQQQQIQRQPKAVPPKDESIMGKVINALYLPAFNEGFNDLVVKPLAGATDFVDRSFDKAYRSVTGEKTPEWMRESKNSIFKSLSNSLQSDYDNRDKPKNIVSETAEGVVGAVPLIASLYTGEGEVSLSQKAPQFVSKVTKLLATTKAATAFHEATEKKEGLAQSVSDAAVGGEKGALEGLTLDAQMLTAGALGKGVANKLAEKGLLAGGKAGEALVHALSTGTVFGGTSVMQNLIDGKDINAHEAAKQFGTGLAFELIPVAKSINDEIGKKVTDNKILQNAAVSTAASNLHAESVIRTLTNTEPEQLKQIADNITDTHETLYANSLEQGMKAYDAKDATEKKSLYADQLLLKTQGDVKFIQDKLKTDAPEIKQQIEDSDELHPQEKQDLINKIDLLTPNPTENEENEQSMAERPAINGEGQQQENEDQTQISNAGNGREKGNAESENNVVNSGEATAEPEIAKQSDADIENRMTELEDSPTFSKERHEYNTLEKEMEKREKDSVFKVPLDKASDAIDALMKKEKEMPNGYGAFLERRDARESKDVIERYTTDRDKLSDSDIKSDFKEALLGNPDTWYADGLKLRESANLAAERGIDINDLLKTVEREFTKDGYTSEDAKSVIARRLSKIIKPKGEENAIQEQEAGEVGVRQPSAVGEGVGGQDQPKKITEPGKEESGSKKKSPLGISKERTKKQREERGLEDIPESEHTTLKDMFKEGQEAIDSGTVKPRQVAQEVSENKRNLSSTEVNALLTDRRKLHDEAEKLHDAINSTNEEENPQTAKDLHDRLAYVENQLDNNEHALRSGARENSLALNSMRSMINSDYSHTSQMARMRAKSGGELTDAMKSEIERYSKELEATKKELEEHKKAESERLTKENILTENKNTQRKLKKTSDIQAIRAERHEIVTDFLSQLEKIRKSGTLSSDIPYRRELSAAAPFMRKMIMNVAKEGIVQFKDVIDTIHDEFEKHLPGLTKRDVMDAINGVYDERKETKNELLEQRNAIVRLSKLNTKIEDLKKGLPEEKSERRLVKKRQDIVDLETEVKQLQKIAKIENLEKHTQELLQNRLYRINKRISNNDFEPPVARPKINSPSAKTIHLEAKVRKAENNFDAMAERLGSHTRSRLEKNLNLYRKINMAFILSGTKVMGKLFGFSEAKKITNEMDELANHLNSKTPLIKKIINRSPRYGGGINIKAEAKAIAARWNVATLKDTWETAKTGAGDLDRIYGKSGVDKDFENEHGMLQFFQYLHSAYKTPAKRAEFFRSLEHRLNFYAHQGEDINDPDVQFKAGLEAYADGKRAILMNDNLLTDKFYKMGLRSLENSKENSPKALGAFIRSVFPITKVPTNFALNAYDRITGAIPGISRATPLLWKAIADGAESLTNEQADTVARILSKGQVGLAMMAMAYFLPNLVKLGGYYTGKRKDNDLKPGDVVIGDISIPHNLAHNDVIEAMQFAATIRRAQEYADDRMEPNGTLTGIGQATKGLASEIPFVDSKYADDFTSGKMAINTAGTFIKNKVEPRLIQEAAEYGDKNTDKKFIQHPIDYLMSETRKRDPKTIAENLKTGIPGLREMVAEKQTPLDKKLYTVTNDDGDKQTLPDDLLKERKDVFNKELSDKSNIKEWTDDFNEDWEDDINQKKLKKLSDYWKNIVGRSDKYIQDKLDGMKAEALDKYLEKQAIDVSEEDISDKVNELPQKNKFTIRK